MKYPRTLMKYSMKAQWSCHGTVMTLVMKSVGRLMKDISKPPHSLWNAQTIRVCLVMRINFHFLFIFIWWLTNWVTHQIKYNLVSTVNPPSCLQCSALPASKHELAYKALSNYYVEYIRACLVPRIHFHFNFHFIWWSPGGCWDPQCQIKWCSPIPNPSAGLQRIAGCSYFFLHTWCLFGVATHLYPVLEAQPYHTYILVLFTNVFQHSN